jgi:glycogen synthase
MFLAEGLATRFDVLVMTDTPGESQPSWRFRVARVPTARAAMGAAMGADLIVMNSLSFRYLVPALAGWRRVVVVHHTSYQDRLTLRRRGSEAMKRFLTRWVPLNICVSDFVASRVHGRKRVIHHAYDDRIFFEGQQPRSNSVLFVGRLVGEKGAADLIDAFSRCSARNAWSLTIVGDGPERDALRERACRMGMADRIHFAGMLSPAAVADVMRTHRILCVPSHQETFGIVALEGMACGCVLVHSDCPGLVEASGGFGTRFAARDVAALTIALNGAMQQASSQVRAGAVRSFLDRRTRMQVLAEYLDALNPFMKRTI